jgi:type I restriction enzyme S subunit
MDLIKIEPKENSDRYYLYAYLRWSDFADNVKNYANGANVLHLLPDRVAEYEMLLPPLELQMKFSALVKDMFEQIDILEIVTDNLKNTRDILIPQLVTGKLKIKS